MKTKNKLFLCIVICLALFLSTAINLVAQQDQQTTITDLLASSDAEFFMHFINQLVATGSDQAYDAVIDFYEYTDSDEVKLYIVGSLDDMLNSNEEIKRRALMLAIQALREGDLIREVYNPYLSSESWKVRVAATHMLSITADTLTPEEREFVLEQLLQTLYHDEVERVRGAAALAMGYIISSIGEQVQDTGNANTVQAQKMSGEFYVERMIFRLQHLPLQYQFQAGCMCKALGMTRSPMAFIPLMEMRTRGFNEYVQRQVIVALDRITGGEYTPLSGGRTQ